ncbi:alanine--glyoxylate aminotransferase family protein [Salinibacterium sp. NG253]|uniref:pyridoxal-phosphate-dependent aminotransferase family protein n=1 Tax=Salinibacterium sp. NG253 TaxID=2792039 RepID=UPI0018CCF05D|nr:alanine--glyoxylate aminotransferase family protein [Salinibacterium sp. NG253]MBH0115906.1 alanine--glyoxylate aminotransferase family protein [Salinibacterium sp. NG253]
MALPDFTLSAGPVSVTARTLAGLSQPMLYHYDPEFKAAFVRTQDKVAQIFKTTNDIVLMQGEAIVGLEGALRSLITPGMHVLNLVQGVFGKGTGYWVSGFGAVLHEIEVGYDDAVSPAAVEAYLDEHPEIQMVCLVASETPSGTVTDVAKIGPLCRDRGILTYIDTVSGVLGMQWETDEWGLDVCVAGAQKCLGGPPGVALISVSQKAWDVMYANPAAPRDSYLSLIDWKEKWLGEGRFPYTPSVSDMGGLEAALDQALEEGIDAVVARHELAAEVTRAGAQAMGLELWAVREEILSACVTSIRLPDNFDNAVVRDLARERYGVMLSHGQGAGNLVRLSHMGPTAGGMHSIIGLATLGRTLADLGMPVNIGAGIEAALSVLSAQRK